MANSPRYTPARRGRGGTGPNASKSKMVTESPWGYSGQSKVGTEAQGYNEKKAMHAGGGKDAGGLRAKVGWDGGSGIRGSKNSKLRGYP